MSDLLSPPPKKKPDSGFDAKSVFLNVGSQFKLFKNTIPSQYRVRAAEHILTLTHPAFGPSVFRVFILNKWMGDHLLQISQRAFLPWGLGQAN